MISPPVDGPAASPLLAAVAGVDAAVEHLITLVENGAVRDLGARSLVATLQALETVRNKLPVVDSALIQFGTEQDIPKLLTQRSMTQVLTGALRLSPAAAHRRVRAAEQLGERHSMLGEPLGPFRPHLAAAQRRGLVTPEHVAVIDTALRTVDRCDPAAVDHGEQLLAHAATELGPVDLKTVADKVVDAIDPDGAAPDEVDQRRRRHLTLARRSDGTWAGEFRLTADLGRKLKDLLDPLTVPATTVHATDRGDGRKTSRFVQEDDRTVGQRRHDALETVLDRVLRRDDNPESGGTPATLVIHVDEDDFLARAGTGRYADGTPVALPTALRLADQAEIAWCIKDSKGAVLDLHRARRIATKDQTLALYARDGGCSFPGCTVEPQWCERHHVIAWWDGGPTNLRNLTLLCQFHHHQFERQRWRCEMRDGLPYWIPPTWIDHLQRPILNHRIVVASWDVQDPLDLASPLSEEPPDPLAA